MTKQQYIDYWVNTAEEDWITVDILFDTKRLKQVKVIRQCLLEML